MQTAKDLVCHRGVAKVTAQTSVMQFFSTSEELKDLVIQLYCYINFSFLGSTLQKILGTNKMSPNKKRLYW